MVLGQDVPLRNHDLNRCALFDLFLLISEEFPRTLGDIIELLFHASQPCPMHL